MPVSKLTRSHFRARMDPLPGPGEHRERQEGADVRRSPRMPPTASGPLPWSDKGRAGRYLAGVDVSGGFAMWLAFQAILNAARNTLNSAPQRARWSWAGLVRGRLAARRDAVIASPWRSGPTALARAWSSLEMAETAPSGCGCFLEPCAGYYLGRLGLDATRHQARPWQVTGVAARPRLASKSARNWQAPCSSFAPVATRRTAISVPPDDNPSASVSLDDWSFGSRAGHSEAFNHASKWASDILASRPGR